MILSSITLPNKRNRMVKYYETPNKGFMREEPRLIVLHYTAGGHWPGSLAWLTSRESRASAHFIVPRSESDPIAQLVPLNLYSWHAGKSLFAGRNHVSRWSWGIEIANRGLMDCDKGDIVEIEGKCWERFKPSQYQAVAGLIKEIVTYWRKRFKDSDPLLIVGHQHVAYPRGRKVDPGPAFDWTLLRDLIRKLGVANRDALVLPVDDPELLEELMVG